MIKKEKNFTHLKINQFSLVCLPRTYYSTTS